MSFSQTLVEAQVIENYSERLKEVNLSSWFQSSESIQVTLDVQSFPLSGYQFRVPASSTVFLDDTLWFYAVGDSSFYLSGERLREELNNPDQGKVNLTVLKKDIKKQDVVIIKGFFDEGLEPVMASESDITPMKKRDINLFYDFFYIAFVLILFLVAVFKVIFPSVLTSIVSTVSVFSAEDFSETNSVQKFFAIDVIFYVMIMSMLMTLMGMAIIKEREFTQFQFLVNGDLNQLFLYWLTGTILLFILTILKFVLLRFMAYIFELGKYEFSHFFYLLRILTILVFGTILVIIYFALNDPYKLSVVIHYALICFFWFYIAGVFMLMLIMMNRVAFKKYHLFAYICTAELVPFLIISKLIIG